MGGEVGVDGGMPRASSGVMGALQQGDGKSMRKRDGNGDVIGPSKRVYITHPLVSLIRTLCIFSS